MPLWPFNKKRRNSTMKGAGPQPLSEKAQPSQPPKVPTAPTGASTPPVPRRSSRRGAERKSRGTPRGKPTEAQYVESKQKQGSPAKENLSPRRGSIEDITALPDSRRLQSSPHLRPIDLERPHIPYNFRQHSESQTSIQWQEAHAKPSRPNTLRSRKSNYDNSGTPQRRRSSKKRKEGALREEEIRAMSAPIPIPKRPGEGPLRRDSKKQRSAKRESNVSLPLEESIHSSMSGIMEQRGWEVGILDVFNPRPAVRLSGTPQYVGPSSLQNQVYPSPDSKRDKDKRPVTKDSARKRQTVGEQADDFDASDLRMLLERDAKRRERRNREQQEKLDRKLRQRSGRNRGDSDKRRRDVDDARRVEESERYAAEEGRIREMMMTPPAEVHPALREKPAESGAADEVVGLGIGSSAAAANVVASETETAQEPAKTEEPVSRNTGTYLSYGPRDEPPQNPFEDPEPEPEPEPEPPAAATQQIESIPAPPGAFETPLGSPFEDPLIITAQVVRMSRTSTPPLSPIITSQSARAPSALAQGLQTSDLPEPPIIPAERRTSEPARERRAGAWATFFRRGGTNLRKPGEEGRSSPSEFSFSNTSRESMRNQPLPAHLVDTQLSQRSKTTGTPVRTQSKFREDLPEMPISPPDSRIPSPDVTNAAASAALARRNMRSPTPMDIPGAVPRDAETDPQAQVRSDTPISPGLRGHGLMSASLASVDSEGSWLASTKRQSGQSGLSRSLSKRKPEFTASYEELGGDKDAEYFRRVTPGPGMHGRTSALAGASPDDESDYGDAPAAETPGEAMPPVHGSVRRQPTLVRRDPRVKSREGLLTEHSAEGESGIVEPDSPTNLESDFEDSPKPMVRNARSVDYGKGHARQMSAGSAKLLDIPASKRPSMDHSRERDSNVPAVPSTPKL